MPRSLDKLLADLPPAGSAAPVYLVHGDLVLAVPAAERIAAALAAAAGCAVETHRHPPALSPLLADLRTFSLFAAAKVVVAVDTAVLADRDAAGDLIDAAAEAVPVKSEGSLPPRERQAASHLLQALRLFDLDPYAGTPEEAVGQLPGWALEGGQAAKRKRGKRQVEDLRSGLVGLLAAARREELAGFGSGDLPELAAAVREGGLPPGHSLVLAERAVAAGHPVVAALEERGAVVQVGSLESGRGGAWEGLDLLAEELERQTGVAIARDALDELARRTLRQEDSRGQGKKGAAPAGPAGGAKADSSARFAGEYRKLANLVQGQAQEGGGQAVRIDKRLVEQAVEDRGEEDVWQLLDAVAQGRGDEALDRLERYIGGAEDPLNARLSFFALFATFCRQLTAIRGLMRVARVPAGEANYARFKDRLAPALQGEVPHLAGARNPVAGLHPFRLHRAYLGRLAHARAPARPAARRRPGGRAAHQGRERRGRRRPRPAGGPGRRRGARARGGAATVKRLEYASGLAVSPATIAGMPASAVVKPCPECEGRGWLVSPDGGAGTARACSCRLDGLTARRFAAAAVPERYAHCRLANFLVSSPAAAERDQLARARAAAQSYVDGFFEADGHEGGRFRESGLLFVGPPGTGKTHLAVAVLAELVERFRLRARFAEFTSLVYQIQATFDPGTPGSQQEVLGPLLDAELLLLDELGAHQPTPWIRDVLYYLVNQRYLRRRPTLFTTNYRLERPAPRAPRATDRTLDRGRDAAGAVETDEAGLLATRISAPLVSRLYEMAQPVELTGVGDFRRDHKAARARV